MVRLELDRIRRARTSIDPVFLETPQFECGPLGDVLGCSTPQGRDAQSGAELQGARHRDSGEPARAARGSIDRGLRRQCRQPGSGAGLQRCAARDPGHHRGRPDGEPVQDQAHQGARGDLRLEGDDIEDARLLARRIAADQGAHLIEDSLDPATCEGTGTVGLELLARGAPLDNVVIALGGGALASGVGQVAKSSPPMSDDFARWALGN